MTWEWRTYRADGSFWLRERGDDSTQQVTYYTATGSVDTSITPNPRPYTAAEVTAMQAAQAAASTGVTRTSLDNKVRSAVAKDGTLDVDLGTADVAWTPGAALTLRSYRAMTQTQIRALTLVQTQELLGKLAPILVDIATTAKRSGKLAVQVYDDDA